MFLAEGTAWLSISHPASVKCGESGLGGFRQGHGCRRDWSRTGWGGGGVGAVTWGRRSWGFGLGWGGVDPKPAGCNVARLGDDSNA